jgi:NADPH-dependent 2,4-dienoyl-CoA reductase/sulfur reductase-like enzyme
LAAESGARVILLDDNPAAGGQIWRGEYSTGQSGNSQWLERLRKSRAEICCGMSAVAGIERGKLLAESGSRAQIFVYEKLILATGARELFLPFPGWTLPGVTGVGGLQALVSGGLPIKDKRVVIAGSGPLLLAVAEHLHLAGAHVVAIVEQAPWSRMMRFATRLVNTPGKLIQAAALKRKLARVPLLTNSYVLEAKGGGSISEVLIQTRSGRRNFACDYLAAGFGLVPNTELPAMMGCSLDQGFVSVDAWQCSSVPGVYCAGEPTGIGGLDKSLLEGQIAGLAATGRQSDAQQLFQKRDKQHSFARSLAECFTLREELKQLPNEETLVCRCEDVPWRAVRSCSDPRTARLHKRCGMGPCQGRVCSPALAFLLGWNQPSANPRPPVFPATMATLSASASDR